MAITIYGCQVNTLSRDYKHVMDFNSPSSQLDYFLHQAWFTNSQNIQGDGFLESLVVPQTLSTCKQCDYLFFRGLDEKVYYYFITKVEYVTQNTTRLYLELDVFSTYLFEMQYLPSFVRRCHVNRWDNEGFPTRELTPEPFQCQNYVVKSKLPIHKNNEGVYIYTTSSPLGDMKSDKGGTGGNDEPISPPSTGGGCGDLNLGIASKNGFLFIKGFEGLAQYAHNIGDGVLTIGYGCTDRYDGTNYQHLKANEPVSDELASEVFANSLTENYGIPLINRLESDGITVNQQEFDALLSFVYNAGLGSLTNSAIYSNLKTGNKQAASQAWLTTNILTGSQFEQGLRDRRQAEANIFLNGQYDIRDTLIYGQGGSISGTLYTSTSSVPPLIENTCSSNPEMVNEMTEDEEGNVWMLPVKGMVTATFPSYPDGTTHSGFDIGGNEGLKIRSSGKGMVVYVGTDTSSGYGNHVVVEMENGTRHWFGHMKTTPYVHVGDSVDQSTVLGIVGSTGNSTGPHVHWEIRKPPYAYDFTCWVNPSPRHHVGDIIKGVGD